jgi:signal transduction histidine kinase
VEPTQITFENLEVISTVMDHIFEAFYTTKGIGGTGLGLWIIHELIEKVGGSVRVRSSAKFPHLRD